MHLLRRRDLEAEMTFWHARKWQLGAKISRTSG